MVERLIEVCAREKYIVLMITAAVVVARDMDPLQPAHRRHP